MDFNMEGVLESVLDEIDVMLSHQHQMQMAPSNISASNTSFSSSCNSPIESVDPLNINISHTAFSNAFNNAYDSPVSSNGSTSPLPAVKPYNVEHVQSMHTSLDNNCNNKQSSPYPISYTNISLFVPECDAKLQLKREVFISKDCTQKLGAYIVRENWGNGYSLLYKYLDYIFRCQSFNKQIVQIINTQKRGEKFLLFHSGLQRKSDNQFLYVLLIPNNIPNTQRWRVPFGHIKHSFLSKKELFAKFKRERIKMNDKYLPKRTKFNSSVSDLLFDDNCSITANWEERLSTNKDRIFKVMGSIAFFDDNKKFMRLSELIQVFDSALPQTQRIAELNPRLAVPQGFVDTTHKKYRMELLLPIIITFPKYNGNNYKFALAVGKNENNTQYVVKSILTMDMAYANARLIGYVDSLWLCRGNNKYKINRNTTDINDFCLNP